ncbi:MAG: 3-oxoacyl-[acyl-carrier-protein] reductase [Ilumatobacteraceae bacterium]|nr:3-oxoacyl-[acyl-carrier-protein] reductase [Ilumatobacteraceae bacterium]
MQWVPTFGRQRHRLDPGSQTGTGYGDRFVGNGAGGSTIVIEGSGALADALRAASIEVGRPTTVVVADIVTTATPFEQITDDQFDAAWERPMQAAIAAFQGAHRARHERLIAIVPTIGMSGAPTLAHVAATAEAIRVMVKSAARQWGADGMTVNCIALAPALFGIDVAAVGEVSLAPPALAGAGSVADDVVPLIRMVASADAHHLTGATLTADGGVWMTA